MSAENSDKIAPSIKYFDELFAAVSSNSIAALHALILRLEPSPSTSEFVYNFMNWAHPSMGMTVLQWAVRVFPETSLRLIKELLDYGAGTELPTNIADPAASVTPLWIAVEKKHPIEIIRLLLSYKADIFFRSNRLPFNEGEKDSLHGKDETETEEGYSLLHLAVKVGVDEEILKELIAAGTDILLNDQSNRLKETPLSN